MEDYEDQNALIGHGDPISFKRLEELKKKAESATCKIFMGGKKGTGFFFEYTIKKEKKYFLMTNNHVLDSNSINKNNISIIYKDSSKKIKLNKRLKGTNKTLDYTIIEILKTDEISKKIKDYFEIYDYMMNNESQNNYLNKRDLYC
jgi:hypothetical protein